MHAQLQQRDCSDSGRFAEESSGIQLEPSDIGLEVGYEAKRGFLRGRRAAGTPSGLPEAAQRGIRASMGARGECRTPAIGRVSSACYAEEPRW